MATHTYQLQISYNAAGQFCQNVLHYSFDDAGFSDTSGAAFALANAFDVANTNILRGILSTHVSILSYKARALNVTGGFEGVLLLPAPGVGTRPGAMQVAAVGPVIILFPVANAKPRGRVFLPGATITDLIDGVFQVAYQAAVASALHIFTDPLTLAGGGAPIATPVVYTRLPAAQSRTVEHARLSVMPGTVRRRQRPA